MLIIEILYLFSTAALAAYGFNSLLYVWLYWRYHKNKLHVSPTLLDIARTRQAWPFGLRPKVTVQLPVYNERHVVKRLVDAAASMDWPAHCLQIQVLDDSTDDTQYIVAAALARHQDKGIDLAHVRRPDRRGYKAGALQYGLESASGEYIAIFDADFIPPPDFLQQTIPCFADDWVGCVQTRWGHVNPNVSRLTKSQALGIDGHFIVEQQARHDIGAFLNFNGTAGVWRRSSMADAGGWEGDTLTEDLDLSYRAQLKGWRIFYRSDVVVPAELPVQIDAFKRQQFRWAKGSLQTAIKLLGRLWQAPEPLWRKLMSTLHLTNYAVHPMMVLNLVLILPISFSQSFVLKLAPFFTLAAIGPPLMYWAAMAARETSWVTRVRRLLVLIALGTGLSVNNTRAAFEAVTGIQSEFKRTPKFAVTSKSDQWQTSVYTLPRDPTAWIEVLLAFYSLGLLIYSIRFSIWWMLFWLILYGSGYFYIAYLAFVQAWQMSAARRQALADLQTSEP